MASAVGFSDLPTEALDEIARRVGPLDNVLCSAVCRSWRRALRTTRLRLLGRRPSRPHNIRICWSAKRPVVKVSPYCITAVSYTGRRRRPVVQTVIDGEVAAGTRIIGCSYGWAVTVDDDTWAMSLLDPFTGRSFPLPPFADSLPEKQRQELLKGEYGLWRDTFHLRKAAVAPGRRLGTYAVMLLHSNGRGLSYLGPGATSWATLRLPRGMPHRYLDAIFHKGAFYTVSCYAELNAWAPDGGGGLKSRRLTSPQREQVWAVLTESLSGDGILMVSSSVPQGYDIAVYNNNEFVRRQGYYKKVHRYAEGERAWLRVGNDLEKMTILVGEGSSLCAPRDNYGCGDYSRVQQASHWFFPYVPRIDPA